MARLAIFMIYACHSVPDSTSLPLSGSSEHVAWFPDRNKVDTLLRQIIAGLLLNLVARIQLFT
jgi:hypothetical protein